MEEMEMIEDDYNDQGYSCAIQNEKIQLEAFETEEEATRFATDSIDMLFCMLKREEDTLRAIRDARNGIGLSKAFDNVDDFMEALNTED